MHCLSPSCLFLKYREMLHFAFWPAAPEPSLSLSNGPGFSGLEMIEQFRHLCGSLLDDKFLFMAITWELANPIAYKRRLRVPWISLLRPGIPQTSIMPLPEGQLAPPRAIADNYHPLAHNQSMNKSQRRVHFLTGVHGERFSSVRWLITDN